MVNGCSWSISLPQHCWLTAALDWSDSMQVQLQLWDIAGQPVHTAPATKRASPLSIRLFYHSTPSFSHTNLLMTLQGRSASAVSPTCTTRAPGPRWWCLTLRGCRRWRRRCCGNRTSRARCSCSLLFLASPALAWRAKCSRTFFVFMEQRILLSFLSPLASSFCTYASHVWYMMIISVSFCARVSSPAAVVWWSRTVH